MSIDFESKLELRYSIVLHAAEFRHIYCNFGGNRQRQQQSADCFSFRGGEGLRLRHPKRSSFLEPIGRCSSAATGGVKRQKRPRLSRWIAVPDFKCGKRPALELTASETGLLCSRTNSPKHMCSISFGGGLTGLCSTSLIQVNAVPPSFRSNSHL